MSEDKFKFTFPSGINFNENDDGNIICGNCNEPFNRIISHLQSRENCRQTNDISLLKEKLNKFKARRHRKQHNERKKKEDSKKFKLDKRNWN